MYYSLKRGGLAFIITAVTCALVAPVATAQIKQTPEQSPSITTSSTVVSPEITINPKTAGPAVVKCSTATEKGTANSGATSLTAQNVGYGGCTATIGASTLPATVDMEGCDYLYHGGTASGAAHHFVSGEVDLTCAGGATGPVLTIFSDAEHKTRICKYTIWNFANHGGITYTNTTGSPNDYDVKYSNVVTETTRNEGILCPKPTEPSLFNGEKTRRAYVDNLETEGSQIGVLMSH